ncbi:TetR/AcrR family transcriptional regulator C-terminal domain-containing protein [Microbispora sp. NPDC046933]|uniref:TetR/AcrR family transcriptional regulator C-terminal domain-containing protein n=1 Tax=Microbispora sp. NPDC046933 TaxID=3155618 RepID=UPI0033E54545
MQATWTAGGEHATGQATGQAAREHFLAKSDRYPVLAAHGPLVADADWDTSFTIGLDWLLDGIQAVTATAGTAMEPGASG